MQTLNERLTQLQTHTAELQNSLHTLTDQQREQIALQTQQRTATQQTLARLTQVIESSNYPFETGKAEVDLTNPELLKLGETIRELIANAHRVGTTPQILIAGNVDDTGTEALNQKLAQERAEHLRDALIRNGVPAFALVAYGTNQAGQAAKLQKNERSTRYRIELF